jgi:DUF1365 family protein
VVVRETVREGRVLDAALVAKRSPMDGRHLAAVLLRYPLVTAKVIVAIHVEALRLWLKGAPYRRRGAPPARPVSIVATAALSRAPRQEVAA